MRGGRVKLQSIIMPDLEFGNTEKGDALYAMELTLSLEKLNNEKLLALHKARNTLKFSTQHHNEWRVWQPYCTCGFHHGRIRVGAFAFKLIYSLLDDSDAYRVYANHSPENATMQATCSFLQTNLESASQRNTQMDVERTLQGYRLRIP